jgi:hypothetical protein
MLGASPPAHPLPASSNNPLGYWESGALLSVNDWILHEAGASWYDCLADGAEALDMRRRSLAVTLIMIGMRSEFPGAKLPLIKDPRICLLLDLWLPALHALKLSPSVLLVLRHPNEVVSSLAVRDGLAPIVSAALWLRHMLAAELATRVCPRHILSYDGLLRDWRGSMALAGERAAIGWPATSNIPPSRVAQYLDPRLRHHEATQAPDDTSLTPLRFWLEEAYAALGGLERDGAAARHFERLDSVRHAFASWCRAEGQTLAADLLRAHPIRAVPRFEVPKQWLRIAENLVSADRALAG